MAQNCLIAKTSKSMNSHNDSLSPASHSQRYINEHEPVTEAS